MGVVTATVRDDITCSTCGSPMPFGFDGSGYYRAGSVGLHMYCESPMPFGFDGSGYSYD